jgi:hypothetical protein
MTLNAMPDDRQLGLAPLDENVDHVRGSPAGRLIIEYGRQHGGAQVAADPDQVRGGCRVHDAMVERVQVTPDHRDPVAAGLARAAGGQQPQVPGALHGRGPVTDLERSGAGAAPPAALGSRSSRTAGRAAAGPNSARASARSAAWFRRPLVAELTVSEPGEQVRLHDRVNGA